MIMSDVSDVHRVAQSDIGFACEDCGTVWSSLTAANECAILDAADQRAARRPIRSTPRNFYPVND
jgi:hypothetical protein